MVILVVPPHDFWYSLRVVHVRSSLRTGFPSLRRGAPVAGYALVSAALIAQITIPWLKGWHDAGGRLSSRAQVAQAGDTGNRIRPAAQHPSHNGSDCAVCRLISQSRGALMAPALRVTATVAIGQTVAPPRETTPQVSADPGRAPRAPPLFLV